MFPGLLTDEVFKKLLPRSEVFSEALYTIDIGQNDLTAGYFLNMSVSEVKAYVPDVLGQFKKIVEVNEDDPFSILVK